MKRMITTRNPELARWQSAVLAHLTRIAPDSQSGALFNEFRAHSMMQGVHLHVFHHNRHRKVPRPAGRGDKIGKMATLSMLMFEFVQEHLLANKPLPEDIARDVKFRKYSTADVGGWAECAYEYYEYSKKYTQFFYNPNHGRMNYGKLDYLIPQNGRVGILGDWGTMQHDSYQLLVSMLKQGVDLVIHIGDIYYAGTPAESKRFVDCVNQAMKEVGVDIPFFTIPGNHEYMSWGDGYFNHVLPGLNSTANRRYPQPASYFYFYSHDKLWQFLGMDTGYHSVPVNPGVNVFADEVAPYIRPDELAWHHNKLSTFPGRTILFSHHQPFSANAEWHPSPLYASMPGVNLALIDGFQQYFDRVAAWFWGHEHNLMVFENETQNLHMGRLIGASAYEETVAEDPYKPNNPAIQFNDKVRISNAQGYYNHSYTILTMNQGPQGRDIRADYYDFPSYGDSDPVPPLVSKLIYSEMIEFAFKHPYKGVVMSNYLPYVCTDKSLVQVSAEWDLLYHKLDGWNPLSVTMNTLNYSGRFKYSDEYQGILSFSIEILDEKYCTIRYALNGKLWNDPQDNSDSGPVKASYQAELSHLGYSSIYAKAGTSFILYLYTAIGWKSDSTTFFLEVTYKGVTHTYEFQHIDPSVVREKPKARGKNTLKAQTAKKAKAVVKGKVATKGKGRKKG